MMTDGLLTRFRDLTKISLSPPGSGATAERHRAIFSAGREDLSLAKLIEAHWDAVAILDEAKLHPAEGAAYAVWASEIPAQPLVLSDDKLVGVKLFCSGARLVDRALVTAGSSLVEIDLCSESAHIVIDESGWSTEAFRMTGTAKLTFAECQIVRIIGENDWYVRRSGFWMGACGPTAAWSGGAAGLLDFALTTKRADPHTKAHLGAMYANVRAMEHLLQSVGSQFDHEPGCNPRLEALVVRHTIEQMCTDTLRRFARVLGPAPLTQNPEVSRRYAELDLFLRQSHAERDLELIGQYIQQ